MKFTCTRENLQSGLAVVAHLASKNTNLPILNNILIRAEGGVVELTTTNLEIGITKRIRGKIEHNGVFTVPAKIFSEYITLTQQDQITLEQEEAILRVKNERTETTLRGLPAEDFPLIPQLKRSQEYVCNAKEFAEAVGQVIFASAYDDARPEISGVFMQFTKKSITLAATDSYRLAERMVKLTKGVEEEVSIIVPVRTLQELTRIIGQEGGTVTFFLTPNQILFVVGDADGGTELVSRLIDGQYPDYKQIIPTTSETEVLVPTEDLLQAVRATSLFSRPGINDITISFHPTQGRVRLEAANTQVGENKQEVEAKVTGKEGAIIFNSRYLLDGLSNIHTPNTIFQMTNSASPGVLRPEGEVGYLYIIMPIKQ